MRRFLLIFAILFLAPIIGHAATCTSTETVTKCAKIPTTIYGYEYTNGQYTSDSWSLEYNDVVLSGNSASTSGFYATCTINSPFNASIDGILGLGAPEVYTAYQACAMVGDWWDTQAFSFTSKLDGDICPDGFYTVPYNVSCGAGMVDTANVPNCSDDTSGESCLIPATSAPAPEYKFTATIDLSMYDDNQMGWEPVTEFGFDLGASGTFYVDWGDGTTETIEKDNTDAVTYTHDYGTTSGTYTVKIGGLATNYSDDEDTPAISFEVDIGATSAYSQAITEISGSLGAIFPTLSDGSQPRFPSLFYHARITEIPSGLFDGIHGAPVSNMFAEAFGGCHLLTSIPENLFSGIVGGAPYMFASTFGWCSGLTSIPEKLFSGITGAAEYMFIGTFSDSGITSIPENLFSGITGAADGMFEYTFQGCNMLTGPSARINGKPLYELWPDNVADWGGYMYDGATGLSDYACIPTFMGGGGETCEPAPEVLCTIGISQIKISTGGSFALYAEKYTQPSLAIKYNDGICYGKLEQGNQSGTMNFNYNGTVYHLAN